MRIETFVITAVGAVVFNASTIAAAQSAGETSWSEVLGVQITEEWTAAEHREFDFWIGEWEMNWRAPVEGEFEHQKEGSWTHQRVFPILGGKALLELAWARDNPGEPSQRGYSIRYLDTEKDRWVMAQNWPNAQNQGSAFLDQLMGREHHGRLTMYSATRRPQPDGSWSQEHRRYNFADIDRGRRFRWDGSNTKDNGKTWLTWYVVDAHRISDLDPFRAAGSTLPGVHEEVLCTDTPHGAYDGLEGVWEGSVTDAEGRTSPASFSAGKVLDGCGVLSVLDSEDAKTLMTIGYHPRLENWVIYQLDDQPGTTHTYFVTTSDDDTSTFTEASTAKIKDEVTPFIVESEFDVEDAERRLVWTEFSETGLGFRVETRNSPQGDWKLKSAYSFLRQP